MLEKIFAGALVVLMVVAVALGVYWLLWLLWCWVMPQLWAGGPQNLISPSYWLFAAAWFLMTLVGRALFKSDKK